MNNRQIELMSLPNLLRRERVPLASLLSSSLLVYTTVASIAAKTLCRLHLHLQMQASELLLLIQVPPHQDQQH
jgi:hypothetical protein